MFDVNLCLTCYLLCDKSYVKKDKNSSLAPLYYKRNTKQIYVETERFLEHVEFGYI